LQRALRQFRIETHPMITRAEIYNAVQYQALVSGLWDSMDEKQQLIWRDQVNAWGVGLGFDDPHFMLGLKQRPPNNAGFHLTLLEPSTPMLIDPTVGQASRPEKNINLPQSICAPVNSEFMKGNGKMQITLPDGVVLIFQIYPDEPPRWRRSPDWIELNRTKGIAKQITKGTIAHA
jgi:hypothetical protein